jgi:hypothetical protein
MRPDDITRRSLASLSIPAMWSLIIPSIASRLHRPLAVRKFSRFITSFLDNTKNRPSDSWMMITAYSIRIMTSSHLLQPLLQVETKDVVPRPLYCEYVDSEHYSQSFCEGIHGLVSSFSCNTKRKHECCARAIVIRIFHVERRWIVAKKHPPITLHEAARTLKSMQFPGERLSLLVQSPIQ